MAIDKIVLSSKMSARSFSNVDKNIQLCIVIIPTYNEILNIEAIIRKTLLLSTDFNILIVDDNIDRRQVSFLIRG